MKKSKVKLSKTERRIINWNVKIQRNGRKNRFNELKNSLGIID